MMGDAISHAVLPGLAIAFVITGSLSSFTMFIGAAVVGILTAVFTQSILHWGKVDESASMGVVFTTLFALGLVIIRRGADSVDLDPDCVLYGAIELVPLDALTLFGRTFEVGAAGPVPRAVAVLALILVLNLAVVLLLYKELKITSFDPALATTLGISSQVMHYVLMTLVAVTTVASFESVGSILVIAMLIVPGAAAHLLSDRLHTMILCSLVIALLSAVLGHLGAITVPGWLGYMDASGRPVSTSTAGMMAVVAGLLFLLAMLAAPRHGLLSKLFHRGLLSLRVTSEDVLGLLYRLEEMELGDRADRALSLFREATGAGPVLRWLAVRSLVRSRRVAWDGTDYRLTPVGREAAGNLVRSHRLWESYLDKHFAIPADHLHGTAERLEHVTDEEMQGRLAATTEQPAVDPHGKSIPPSAGPIALT